MLAFSLGGVLMRLAYGILIRAQAVILTNGATGTLIAVATLLTAWGERRPTRPMVADQLPKEG